MNVKLFEVRDRATLIPVMATQLTAANEAERKLLQHAGYGDSVLDHQEYILVGDIDGGGGECHSDPFKHKLRELREAHQYILDNWYGLDHGSVIDLEYIRHEKPQPSISDLK